MDECMRLRQRLEEVMRSKDTFADPQELKIIEEKFKQRDAVIAEMQKDNRELAKGLATRDEEKRQLEQIVQKLNKYMKKAQISVKNNQNLKREVKEKDRNLHKLRR